MSKIHTRLSSVLFVASNTRLHAMWYRVFLTSSRTPFRTSRSLTPVLWSRAMRLSGVNVRYGQPWLVGKFLAQIVVVKAEICIPLACAWECIGQDLLAVIRRVAAPSAVRVAADIAVRVPHVVHVLFLELVWMSSVSLRVNA